MTILLESVVWGYTTVFHVGVESFLYFIYYNIYINKNINLFTFIWGRMIGMNLWIFWYAYWIWWWPRIFWNPWLVNVCIERPFFWKCRLDFHRFFNFIIGRRGRRWVLCNKILKDLCHFCLKNRQQLFDFSLFYLFFMWT